MQRMGDSGRDHDDLELRSDTVQVGVFHIANEYKMLIYTSR